MSSDTSSAHEGVRISKPLVVVNSISSVAAKILNMSVLLWAFQYLLNRIPAEEFAILPVVTATMVFAPLFFSFFTGGISRYVVTAYAKHDNDRVTAIVSSIFPPLVAASLVFLLIGGLFAYNIDHVLNIAPRMVGDAQLMTFLLVVSFSIQMIALPFGVGYHVKQAFVELNVIAIARDLFRISLLFMLLLGVGPQVLWVVVATVISEIVHTVVVFIRSRAKVPSLVFRPALFSRQQAGELMNFGVWTSLGRLGSMMHTNAATIVLNIFGTPVDVTSYYIGATFYRQIVSTVAFASQPLLPVITAMHAQEDQVRLGHTVFRGGRYALWAAMMIVTPLAIYSEAVVSLYLGNDYMIAATVIVLLMVIFPFTHSTVLLPMTAMAMARVREFFLPAFLFQVAGLVLMIGFSVHTELGAVGVTLSLTLAAVGSQLLYFWWLTFRLTEQGPGAFVRNVLYPGLLPAIAGGAVWAGLNLISPPQSWATLILFGGIGACFYVIALGLFALNASERKDLQKITSRFALKG
ncbi:MAG: hypothetical protein AAFR68_12645 [Pseudomonadota bacterium]